MRKILVAIADAMVEVSPFYTKEASVCSYIFGETPLPEALKE